MRFTASVLSIVALISPLAAQSPKFEVASVKFCRDADFGSGGGRGGRGAQSPERLELNCITTANLIRMAYLRNASGKPWPISPTTGLRVFPVSQKVLNQPLTGPGWIDSERYRIDAKAETPQAQEMLRGPMLQALLEDRFKLKLHRETKESPVFELTVAKGGAKLSPSKPGSCHALDPNNPPTPPEPGQPPPRLCGLVSPSGADDGLEIRGITMADLCRQLSASTDRDIIDKTGLTGVYDVHLALTSQDLGMGDDTTGPAGLTETDGSAIAGALHKLGLEMKAAKGSAEFLVIDHIERPPEN